MHRRHFLQLATASALTPALARSATTPRIAIGGIGTECSTYSRIQAHLPDFTILRGPQILADERFRFLAEYPIPFLPTLVATAVPGGPLAPETYAALKSDFLTRLRALLPLDGLFLPMHGAMFVTGMSDAEGDWFAAVRQVVGPRCLLAASYDLHGNVSQRVVDTLDIFSAFRTAPHIDKQQTMQRACSMLLHSLATGIHPVLTWCPIPVLLPGERTSTEWNPGRDLWAQLPALNRQPGILDVSLLVGYVWADEPRATASAVVTSTPQALPAAAAITSDLARQYWAARTRFDFGTTTLPLPACIQRALAATSHPVILADSGDNPTGGGTGDRPQVLAALLAAGARNTLIAGITDAPATNACYAAGPGRTLPLRIGAALDPLDGPPVAVSARVQYLLPTADPALRQAVVQVAPPGTQPGRDGITVVLATYRRPYHDVADFTQLQLSPSTPRILVVKSGYLSPDLKPLANPSLMALTDGAINQDITRLTNLHRQPSWPFVPTLTYTPHPRQRSHP